MSFGSDLSGSKDRHNWFEPNRFRHAGSNNGDATAQPGHGKEHKFHFTWQPHTQNNGTDEHRFTWQPASQDNNGDHQATVSSWGRHGQHRHRHHNEGDNPWGGNSFVI